MKQEIEGDKGDVITVAYRDSETSPPKNITGKIETRYNDHKVLIDPVGGGKHQHLVVINADVDESIYFLDSGEEIGRFICIQEFEQ